MSPPSAAAWSRIEVGKQLGRYVVLEVLGRGAMGEVLRAYDPKLRRELAIKRILPTRLPVEAETRLVREAQAMAQLGHPNVVAVYDVDVSDHGVLVAMEYVRGTTLERWVKQPRPWQDIVRVFVQAARGLQAAHDAGLVHRDFKPANVLVAEDGRARVADFGLVKVTAPDRSSIDGPDVGASGSSLAPIDRLDANLTQGDVVLGTPKYMAPEQHGSPAVPASDQFAFCVSMWEAFVGEAPYRGQPMDVIAAKFRGPPPWPRGVAIPRRIVAAIERGLSPRPEDRFASMDALAAEIRDAGKTRRTAAIGLAAAVLGAGALATFALVADDASKCTGAAELLEPTWGTTRRAAVEQAFVAVDTPISAPAWSAVAASLDVYAERWAKQHREACEATTVRGEQSTAVMDLRMGCLDQALGELEAIVGVFEQADPKTVERAHRLVENLPELARCEDIAALQKEVAPPPAGPIADAVAQAREDLARSRALYRIGRYEESLALADDVYARTRELDYPPIRAEAALGRGDVLDYLGRYEDSEAALRESLQIAMREGSFEAAIKAASSLVYVLQYLGRSAESQWPADLALDLAIRTNADPVVEARARNAMGAALRNQAKWDASEAAYREGIRRLAEAVGERDGRVATLVSALGSMLSEAGRYDRAEPPLRRAMELRRELLGPKHPDSALSGVAVAHVLMELGRFAEAEEVLRDAEVARREAHGPDHFFTAKARTERAYALTHLGRAEEALPELEAAVRGLEATLPEGHGGFIDPLHNYSFALWHLDRHEDAEAQARRGLAMAETAYGPEHPLTGEEVAWVAEIVAGRGRLDEALELSRRAVTILETTRSGDHVTTLEAKAVLGEVLLAKGDRTAALPVLEEVWTLRDRIALAPHQKARSAFALARALTDTRPISDRARSLAEAAAAAYRDSGPAFETAATEVNAWLRE